jgi:hypothetical protein
MLRFVGKLLNRIRPNKKGRAAKKSSPQASLRLEGLEARDLMSVSSAAIHAVAVPGGQSHVFYFDSKHLLALDGHELPQNVRDTPNGIQTFSAGLDAINDPEVVVKAKDGSLWKWNEGDWTKILSASKGATSFAAADGDRVYAIYGNGSLHEFDGNVWSKVPGSTTVRAIDAITDGRGNDAVFALLSNGNFGEYFGGHFDLMLAANARFGLTPVTVGNFTAATDQFGDGIVYGTILGKGPHLFINFGLYQIGYGSQTFITQGATSFSGTTGGLWINKSDGSLDKYDATGLHSEPHDGTGFASISAASGSDVYYVQSGTLTETVLGPLGFLDKVITYGNYGPISQ